MDLLDKDIQIELNQKCLEDEVNRYIEIRSRIGYITIFYTIFAAYFIQLFQFALNEKFSNIIFDALLLIFIILIGLSIYHSIKLLLPVTKAFKSLPKYFYEDIKNLYIQKGIAVNHLNPYIKETYRIQLEKAVEINFTTNNKKSKNNFYAFIFCICALIPYVICVGIKLSNDHEDIQKAQIIHDKEIDSLYIHYFKNHHHDRRNDITPKSGKYSRSNTRRSINN